MYSTNFNADHWNMSVLNELCQFTGAMISTATCGSERERVCM